MWDLDHLNEGEWFRYFDSRINENGDTVYDEPVVNAERVCLRAADADILDKIHKQTRKTVKEWVLNPKTRQMVRGEAYEQTPEQIKLESALIWDHAIVDWELLDTNGNLIPCIQENKVKLMKHPPFARFVIRCLQLSSSSRAEQEGVAEKN